MTSVTDALGTASALMLWVTMAASGAAQSARTDSVAVSAASQAQTDFVRGLAALHNFEYEEANEAFVRAQKADPGHAMAFWGEAMTYHQTLWRNEDLAAGRRVLGRLGATAAIRASKAQTTKERAYLAAVETLFGPGDPVSRVSGYAEAMGRLYASDPDDPDVASLYALALLGTMSRSLIGMVDAHEGHAAALAGSKTQTQVAAILERALASKPNHPGALHYLLHNYDDPDHARLALSSARTYAQVAPESSHARHMPAHIFLQLGLWADAEAADRTAFAASDAWVKRKSLPAAMRSYHALSWRQYELLQLGRFREAWDTIGEIAPVVKSTGDLALLSDLSTMRARYVVETRRWDVLASERNFGNVNELCAIGFSAAHARNGALAELARQALAARATSPQEGDLRPAIAIMERQVSAMIEWAAGHHEKTVEILKAAAKDELKLPPPLGLPAPIKPSSELLGEVLLEVKRPAEAIEPFTQALARNPNRTLSVLGLARASSAAGQLEEARQHYRGFLANYDRADSELPELAEARAALQADSVPTSSSRIDPVPAVAAAVGIVLVVGLTFFARRLTARQPRSTTAPGSQPKRRRRRGRS
ncbi:MAG: tetratricopeptide repeat protein [Vicinamibacterales bacterium]